LTVDAAVKVAAAEVFKLTNCYGASSIMGDFFKKHLDDIMVYTFGILMAVACIMFCAIIIA